VSVFKNKSDKDSVSDRNAYALISKYFYGDKRGLTLPKHGHCMFLTSRYIVKDQGEHDLPFYKLFSNLTVPTEAYDIYVDRIIDLSREFLARQRFVWHVL
jgi:hypothetical protein